MFELSRLQRGLEALYRVETNLDVADFLIDAETRGQIGLPRHSREQLVLSGDGAVGLFICETVLANLAANDPSERVDESNYADLMLAVEGVSHFVYLAWRASADTPVSGLELELQAEVDKYVTLVLAGAGEGRALHSRLFRDFEYEDDLSSEERERYGRANEAAARYAAHLEREYVRERRMTDMLSELRRFYRLPLAAKLEQRAA